MGGSRRQKPIWPHQRWIFDKLDRHGFLRTHFRLHILSAALCKGARAAHGTLAGCSTQLDNSAIAIATIHSRKGDAYMSRFVRFMQLTVAVIVMLLAVNSTASATPTRSAARSTVTHKVSKEKAQSAKGSSKSKTAHPAPALRTYTAVAHVVSGTGPVELAHGQIRLAHSSSVRSRGPPVASAAASGLQRFLAVGIDGKNPVHAKQQVMGLASVNDNYGDAIAHDAGRDKFVASEWHQQGYGPAPANTSNSGETWNGGVQATGGGVGVKSLKLFNIVSHKTVFVMVRCGNPRLHQRCNCRPKPIRKVNRLPIFKKFKKVVKIKCPTGIIPVTVTGTARGYAVGKVYGTLIGSARLKIKEAISLAVKLKVRLGCPKVVVPPTTPPQKCANGTDNNGNCVTQTTTAECPQGQFKDSTGNCVAISNNCGNVNNGGSNNTQGGNCNNTCTGDNSCNQPPPPCQPCQPPPPPPPAPPKITAIDQVNDVFVDSTWRDWSVSFSFPSGDDVAVIIDPKFGTVSNLRTSSTGSSGTDTVDYTAPGEVPGGAVDHDCDADIPNGVIPSGYDVIKATVYDNTTGLSDVRCTQPFRVKPVPANPGASSTAGGV
jgi:hypothetical protein